MLNAVKTYLSTNFTGFFIYFMFILNMLISIKLNKYLHLWKLSCWVSVVSRFVLHIFRLILHCNNIRRYSWKNRHLKERPRDFFDYPNSCPSFVLEKCVMEKKMIDWFGFGIDSILEWKTQWSSKFMIICHLWIEEEKCISRKITTNYRLDQQINV